jgi:hypothetical protein
MSAQFAVAEALSEVSSGGDLDLGVTYHSYRDGQVIPAKVWVGMETREYARQKGDRRKSKKRS